MNNSDYGEGASKGQPQPPIVPGCLYTQKQVTRTLGIGPGTIAGWIKAGLRVYKPDARAQYIFADDLIDFIKSKG